MKRSKTPKTPRTPQQPPHEPILDEDDIDLDQDGQAGQDPDGQDCDGQAASARSKSRARASAGSAHWTDEPDGDGAPFVPPPGLPIHASVTRAMQSTAFGGMMAVVVRVTGVRFTGATPQGKVGYYHSIFLHDLESGAPLMPLPTADLDLVDHAQRLLREGGLVVAYGRYDVLPPTRKNGPLPTFFTLLGLGPVPGSAITGASLDERRDVRALIDDLRRQPGGIARHLLSELADIHHVATDHLTPRFLRCVRLVLLQAVSEGAVGEATNPRISSFFLSEPGQGKGVLARYAQTLSPLHRVVQPAQITLPGLSVRMEQRQMQGWITTPGALAKAHGGVCVLHDIHHLPRKDLGNIQSVLMTVCEEGSFTPAKVSDTPYLAECAVHMNGNHHHVVLGQSAPRGTHARLADIGMPLDLFSRVDVVAALHMGDDIDKVAIDVVRQRHDRTPERAQVRRGRARRLKLIVAELREQIPEVDLRPIDGAMTEAVAGMQNIVREYAAQGGDQAALVPQALSMRMARSLGKLIAASARLDGRSVATLEDLQDAVQLLSFKLEVVKWICGDFAAIMPQGTLEQQRRRTEATQELRRHRILEQCGGGGPLTLDQIAARVGAGRRTVARDLRFLGIAGHGGTYRVPTPLEREKQQEEAERRGQQLEPLVEKEVEETYEDELVRSRPHKFYDSLPAVPVIVRPVLRAFAWARGGDAADLGKRLFRYGLTETLDPYLRMGSTAFEGFFDPDGAEVPGESLQMFGEGLAQEDWEARVGFVMAVYTALPNLAVQRYPLQDLLRRTDLPVGVKRHVQSALLRMDYYDQCKRQGVRPPLQF